MKALKTTRCWPHISSILIAASMSFTISRAKRLTWSVLTSPRTGWSDMQWETAANADLTARTAKVLHQRILEKKLETIYSEMELPLAPLLYRMERAGLKLDRATLADLSNYLGLELRKLTVKIYELAGREFNIGSPKQVGEVLSELAMTSGRKTSTGRISTSKAVLEELAQTLNCHG